MITLILDKLLIKYASPTLGGIKTGSLFKVYSRSLSYINAFLI